MKTYNCHAGHSHEDGCPHLERVKLEFEKQDKPSSIVFSKSNLHAENCYNCTVTKNHKIDWEPL